MAEPKPQPDPWTEVGKQPVRMPERMSRKTAVRKTVGFVLLGLGGIVMLFFAYFCVALYYGVRQMANPEVPSITTSNVALTLAAGMIGLALMATGLWFFKGPLPKSEKFPE
jgi:hypothetical protein